VKARLIVADDHEVVRQGLRDMVAHTPDLEVVAEAGDGLAAEKLARTVAADLLILDIAMPLKRGIQVLEALRAQGNTMPVMFFSMYPASQYVDYARRAGAQGFVSKDAAASGILRAMRRILAGGTHFPAVLSETSPADAGGQLLAKLSRREVEVMQGLLEGTSLIEIAARLGVSPQSVTTYRRRLLEKLGVKANVELVELADRLGML